MKKLAAVLSAVLLMLVIAVLLLPFSASGTRFLVTLIPASSPLQVTYAGGRLAGELELANLRLTLDGLKVELAGVHTELRPACLWQSMFCFTRLDIDRLDVVVEQDDTTDEAATEAPSTEPVQLPVRLRAPGVRIAQTRVRWPGGVWQQAASELDIELTPEGVYLGSAILRNAELALETAAPSAPAEEPSAPAREPSARVALKLPELRLPLTLAVDALTLEQPRLRLGDEITQFEAVRAAARWRGEQLEIETLELVQAELGRLAASGHVNMTGDWPLQLVLRADLTWAELPTQFSARTLQLDLSGDVGDLQLELLSPGQPRLALSGAVDLLAPELPFKLSAVLNGEEPLGLAEVEGGPAAFAEAAVAWPLELTATGSLEAQALTLRAQLRELGYESLDIMLSARHTPGSLEVDKLQLDGASAGNLSASGVLDYGEAIAWRAVVETPGLQMPRWSDYLFGSLSGGFATSGQLEAENWRVVLDDVDLSGDINGLPALVEGGLTLDSATLVHSGALRAQVNGGEIDITADEGTAGEVHAELGIADLSRWSRDAGGSVLLNADWSQASNRLALRGSVQGVYWNSLRADRGVLEGSMDLGENLGASLRGEGQLRLDQVELAGVALEGLGLKLTGGPESAELGLSITGDITGELGVAATAVDDGWQLTVPPTEFATPLGPLSLGMPIEARVTQAGGSVSAHCWLLPESELCLADIALGATGGLTGQLTGDLALVDAVLPQQVEARGPLRAEVSIAWSPDAALQAEAQLTSPGGAITQFHPEGESASFTWESLAVTVEQGADGLALEAGLQQDGRQRLALNVALPSRRDGALQGLFAVDALQVAALRPFLPQLTRIDGELSGRIELSGNLQNPQGQGELRWRNGLVRLEANPTEVDDIDVRIALDGTTATLAGGAMVGGGQLALSGDAQFGAEPALRLDIKGDNHRLLYPPSTQLEVSPDLRLRITPSGIHVRGEVQVHEGLLAYEELPPGSVTLSDDVVEVDFAGNPLDAHNPFGLDADLRLRIEDRFRIRGKDLNLTVGGDLNLRQAPERPLQLFGNLNIIGGEFRAYGQRLLVRQGRIAFSGAPENPELNLRAEREIPAEDVRAGVTVTGTLEQPQLTVYAEPSMSQTEALSYLLRGRGLDSGAGADGTAMALSLGTSLMNRSALVEELNNLPGLRNVEFGTDGSEDDTAATVSGYIGERIYLSYGVGLYEPINVLTARLYLQARLWLEVVSRLESSVDLYYSFDID
ncbi:MAG: hypothetical protein CME39_12755 [Haliea sp.]|nr:hypothetical protein [Haliea sp.]